MAESNLHEGSEAELGAKRFDELLDQNPPDQLYHYTGQKGLLNILESGELWATKVQYMNDTTEFRLAVELADSRLKERIKIIPDEGGRKLVKYIIDGLSGIAHVNICSVSFCEEPDLLSQWRGYSSAGWGCDWVSLCRSKKSGLERRQPPWPLHLRERRSNQDH
jgi:hypothetical protein